MIRSADSFKNAIVFCNRKREVAVLHRSLVKHGFNAVALHGDLDQSARMAALDKFRKGEASLLVASDVAARGLDIPDVSHVFNFDVPHHPEDYIHRIGRTGRAGRSGTAITIVAPADTKAVAAIEKLTGQPISWTIDAGAPAGASEEAADARPAKARREHHRDRSPRPERKHAPVVRAEDNRHDGHPKPRRPAERPMEGDDSTAHLPAFLLRPVRVKA
jgi:superfamily II DNA/RNA helicase